MKRTDVVIVGAGHLGHRVAARIKNKSMIMIALPNSPETLLVRHHAAMLHKPFSPAVPSLENTSIEVLSGPCRFLDPHTLMVNDRRIEAEKFVLIPGGVYNTPDVPGLGDIRVRFPVDLDLSAPPPTSILIVGGGPSGVVYAQKLAQKGAHVTLLSNRSGLLTNEDPDISSAVLGMLKSLGVQVHLNSDLVREQVVAAEEVLFCTGLRPNTEGFDLDKAGVYVRPNHEIAVNEEMRTSASNIWACGMATGGDHHLLLEEYQADLVAMNIHALYFNKTRFLEEPLPKVIETVPPIARIGWTETQARAHHKDVRTLTVPLADLPKARLLGETQGLIKLVGRQRGNRLLGAHIMAPHAQEMILYFDLVLRAEISLDELTDFRHFVGLTYGELILQALRKWNEA